MRLTVLFALCVGLGPVSARADDATYDVVVYGGTSAGVIAAVQATRMGKSAVVVAPEKHLGGLTAGGLGWTDSGRKEVIGGLSREFYQRLKAHYDQPSAWRQQQPEEYRLYRRGDDAMWVFEPHVAEATFEQFLEEYDVPVHREAYLNRETGVAKSGPRITAITTLDGKTFHGRMFIDATYEGDLTAAAGVSYTVGRESNAQYDEALNGIQTVRTTKHQFESPVDPYVVPGDPSSGLLPRIHPGSPGVDGEADHRVQAYCFRMCLTDDPDNRLPFPKPDGYDPLQYELLARYLKTGWRAAFKKFDPAPNRKTDTNNHGAFSTDNIGMNYDYPEASYERRREIIAEHEQYQKGLMYFLQNDPRVPDDVQEIMKRWGLARDEFTDNGNWPHQIYVREARRMVSDYVHTEHDCRRKRPCPDPVGMGSYNMDSHNVQRYVDENGHVRNEGDIQVSPGGPYLISYRAIVPKEEECTNLLVPVCLSSSHIAYGSIRMEPVFMILGHSAAAAAALAIDDDLPVQQLEYSKLREQLDADGQVLEIPPGSVRAPGLDPAKLPGLVIDDEQAIKTGNWGTSASVGGFVGIGYIHDGDESKGRKSVRFDFEVPKTGRYEVRVAYTANPNRATNVPISISHVGGKTTKRINQKRQPQIDKAFTSVGDFEFSAGGEASVTISNADTDGYVVVDAVQLLAP